MSELIELLTTTFHQPPKKSHKSKVTPAVEQLVALGATYVVKSPSPMISDLPQISQQQEYDEIALSAADPGLDIIGIEHEEHPPFGNMLHYFSFTLSVESLPRDVAEFLS